MLIVLHLVAIDYQGPLYDLAPFVARIQWMRKPRIIATGSTLLPTVRKLTFGTLGKMEILHCSLLKVHQKRLNGSLLIPGMIRGIHWFRLATGISLLVRQHECW